MLSVYESFTSPTDVPAAEVVEPVAEMSVKANFPPERSTFWRWSVLFRHSIPVGDANAAAAEGARDDGWRNSTLETTSAGVVTAYGAPAPGLPAPAADMDG